MMRLVVKQVRKDVGKDLFLRRTRRRSIDNLGGKLRIVVVSNYRDQPCIFG